MKEEILTKREYFAAMIISGLAAGASFSDFDYDESAEMAVKQADHLIKELTKTPSTWEQGEKVNES